MMVDGCSLLPVLDAGLGVVHSSPHSAQYLLDMRFYMPKPHRDFIALVAGMMSVVVTLITGPCGGVDRAALDS